MGSGSTEAKTESKVSRTFQIRPDQDRAIQDMARKTGDPLAAVLRRLIDQGLKRQAALDEITKNVV